ncbi:GNAT family N-acetyltransferase [Kaistella palustris]|uniref:GNAT family N-acetyltransferase n=1 Tax=Kaistella palustris TaxID=493376 RepID=UPI000411AE81|nr:GNAT family N-acetyltransferase [Kaistella palustris]
MRVRKAVKNDIQKIVDIHSERFSGFFLSTLGKPFLRVFYGAFLKEPAILLVLEDEGAIKGFAAGSRDNRGFYRKLLLNSFSRFFLVGIRILFSNPAALKRMAVNSRTSSKNNPIFAELLSIATLKNKKSYGKFLLDEFEKEVARKNTDHLPVALTTDVDDNEKAVQFYKDCGYEIHEVFESYQHRKMYRFLKKNA